MQTAPEGAAAGGKYEKCLAGHGPYGTAQRLDQASDSWRRLGDVVSDILTTTIARRYDVTRQHARVVAEAVLHDGP